MSTSRSDARYSRAEPERRRGMAARTAHPAEPAVRRQRAAHRSRRPGLHRAGDRQPDQRARCRHRPARDHQRQGRRHHRARRRRLRPRRQPLRDRGDGRPGERARDKTAEPACFATTCPCANGITVHQGRLFINECREGGRLMELDLNGGAPADPSGEPAVPQRHGGRPRRAAVLPADDRQRDLAHRPAKAVSHNGLRAISVCPTR